ncbi:ATP-dependent Clp protease adapter ClpS [Spelaeicoccus albus]|uniref:ATP-dependent Clp protease adapter protein ClpS n=1 Tax=Spelaeicoccus albus TaxID=1280376 RepID=A0A7Z0D5Q6_9MICO|nr:ATP-dependent Clp protease adapter ClpS [Spelaeicoccus albus]NYI69226.1 ATP-dependent Clp protease adaptor protein ClpS [Spelaeicoccus albus]
MTNDVHAPPVPHAGIVTASHESAVPDAAEETASSTALLTRRDVPWVTLVWNDPVNLMSYVSYVFRSYFGYSKSKAEKLMLQVHNDGKSVVASGSREEMERDTEAMHGYGLWATFQREDSEG